MVIDNPVFDYNDFGEKIKYCLLITINWLKYRYEFGQELRRL